MPIAGRYGLLQLWTGLDWTAVGWLLQLDHGVPIWSVESEFRWTQLDAPLSLMATPSAPAVSAMPRHTALTAPAVQAVVDLNMHCNEILNPPRLVMHPPAPPLLSHEHQILEYENARRELYEKHEQALRQDDEEIQRRTAEGTLDSPEKWRVRAKDRFPGLSTLHERAKLGRQLWGDASMLRQEMRIKQAMSDSPVQPREEGEYSEHRTRHFKDFCTRIKQDDAKLGPQPGIPRTSVGGAEQAQILRSSARARLAIARDSFLPQNAKTIYTPTECKLRERHIPKRFDQLSALEDATGLDRTTVARLFITFRQKAGQSSEYDRVRTSEYRVDQRNYRKKINRIDFSRMILGAKVVPTMDFAVKLYEMLQSRSSHPEVGGLDAEGFVKGLAELSNVSSLGIRLGWLWELFQRADSDSPNAESLSFNGLVQLMSWVYHLIDYDTTKAASDCVVLVDHLTNCAEDGSVSKQQLVDGVQEIPETRQKVSGALRELWLRVGNLTHTSIGDSRPIEDHIRTLEFELGQYWATQPRD